MYEDDIKKVDEWFAKHTDNNGTYHLDDIYSVCASDLQEFADFLDEEFPEMCGIYCTGIYCTFAGEDCSIIFLKINLEEAIFL